MLFHIYSTPKVLCQYFISLPSSLPLQFTSHLTYQSPRPYKHTGYR